MWLLKERGFLMKRLLFILLVLFPALSFAENSFSIDIGDSFVSSLKNSDRLSRLSSPEITLPTLTGEVTVELEQTDIRSSKYKSIMSSQRAKEEDKTQVVLFKGITDDSEHGDFYRFTLIDDGASRPYLDGYYSVDHKLYRLEKSQDSQEYVVSNLTSEDVDHMVEACGSPHEEASLDFDSNALFDGSEPVVASADLRTITLATEADFEYFTQEGGTNGANAKILSIINGVDAIYRSQLGVALSVIHQNVWTTPSDPYTATNSSSLLSEFQRYWRDNVESSVDYDLAHLFTGRDLDGGVVGVAYVSAVFSSFRYGLSQRLNLSHFDVVLTAHEIGHNLGSSHDSCSGNDSLIMCPSLVPNASTFSANSIASISNVLGNTPPDLSPQPELTPVPTPTPVPQNNAPTLFPIGSKTVREGQALNFNILGTDPDGDNLSYTASFGSLVNRAFSYTPAVGTVPSNASSRVLDVTFTVSDGRASDSETISITVTRSTVTPNGGGEETPSGGNQTPSIINPGTRNLTVGQTLLFAIRGTDPDGDSLVYTSNNLPSGVRLRQDDGTFEWTPSSSQVGTFQISITVRDPGGLTGNTSFNIVVTSSDSQNPNTENPNPINPNPQSPRGNVRFDFNGDGLAEASIYRGYNGTRFSKDALGNLTSSQLGVVGDIPVSGGDIDGDGTTDDVAYSPSEQVWYIRQSSNNAVSEVAFGTEDAIPSIGDFDGDGRDNLAYFRPSLSQFVYRRENGSNQAVSIGRSGDLPIPCDYDGDGDDDIGLYDGQGNWSFYSNGRHSSLSFGTTGDVGLAGYRSSETVCEPMVYRPSDGRWFARSGLLVQFGAAFDTPLLLDIDGDGRENLVLHRAEQARFFVLSSNNSSVSTIDLGQDRDLAYSEVAMNFALRNTNNSGLQARGAGLESVFVHNRQNRTLVNYAASGAQVTSLNTQPGQYLIKADYDGDQVDDRATYSRGTWILSLSTGSNRVVSWGGESDIPVSGDFDGDGMNDIGIYRDGAWFILSSAGRGLISFQVGQRGDIVIPGDYDGDGITDPATVNPSTLVWQSLSARTSARLPQVQWGVAGDTPVSGDFDGDGIDDRGVFRPSTGFWFLYLSGGNQRAVQWGVPGDLPAPNRVLSANSDDLVVFRPSTGEVFVRTILDRTSVISSNSGAGGQLINTSSIEAIR